MYFDAPWPATRPNGSSPATPSSGRLAARRVPAVRARVLPHPRVLQRSSHRPRSSSASCLATLLIRDRSSESLDPCLPSLAFGQPPGGIELSQCRVTAVEVRRGVPNPELNGLGEHGLMAEEKNHAADQEIFNLARVERLKYVVDVHWEFSRRGASPWSQERLSLATLKFYPLFPRKGLTTGGISSCFPAQRGPPADGPRSTGYIWRSTR